MVNSFLTLFTATVIAATGIPNPSKRPMIRITLPGGSQVESLYDTGACVSMIDEKEFRNIPINIRPQKDLSAPWLTLHGADHNLMQVKGCYMMRTTIMNRETVRHFYVVKNLSTPVILGIDFINQHSMAYDPDNCEVHFTREWECAAATTSHQITIEPNSSVKIPVHAKMFPFNGKTISGPINTVCSVDCTEIPLLGKDQIVSFDKFGKAHVLIDNPLDIPVTVPRGSYIGSLERVNLAECAEVHFDMGSAPLSEKPKSTSTLSPEKRELLTNAVNDQLKGESAEIRQSYLDLILANADVFSDDKFDLGRTHVMSHKISLKDQEPVYVKQFRIPETHRSVILQHLQNWLKLGVVSPSKSHYNSPIFCVPKRCGGLRPVLDFRALNAKTFVDKYSMNEIQDCIDSIGRAKSRVFSRLDLTCGFWQLPLEEDSREYTMFTIPGVGSFSWNCTPMGLLGSPASFGRLMDFVMRNIPAAICYQDDVLIHSADHASQLLALQEAFNRIRAHGLKLNISKCQFGQREVSYLGFLLTPDGILPGLDKTKAIREFEAPTTVRGIREFVGLCNYFRNSIKDFAFMSQELTKLTRKDCEWTGGLLPPAALRAFKRLRQALLDAPVLAYPDPTRPYHLLVDAAVGSDTEDKPGGMGASLIQFDDDENPHPVGYVSRSLSAHEKNYSAYLLEHGSLYSLC